MKSTPRSYRSGMLRRAVPALLVSAVAAAFTVSSVAAAQTYPSKPVRVIVNSTPGGLTDIIARLVAGKMSQSTGQTFVVENRPGAGGAIGASAVAKSDPDGYTVGVVASAITTLPALLPEPPFNPEKDFAPVALLMSSPMVLVTGLDSPYKSVKSLIEEAKSKPGEISIASGGVGTMTHLIAEQFQEGADISLVHVAYNGGGPALVDVMAGHVPVFFDTLTTSANLIKENKLRGLAVVDEKRSSAVPNVPTLAESGYPHIQGKSWFALIAPAGTPDDVITRLNKEANAALNQPDVKERISSLGASVEGGSPKVLADQIAREVPRWAKLISDRGIKSTK